MLLEQVTNPRRRDVVPELLQLPGDADVAPSVLLGHPQRQFFGGFPFRGSAGAFGRIVEGPLPTLHLPIPRQQRFRSDDGNGVS